jgi:biopolymer transport protein ExbB/TolQ
MKRKRKLITWLVGGGILALGPIWGMIGTVVGMVTAFGHLGQASPDTEILANDISLALYTTVAGFIACPIGILIVVVAAIELSKPPEHEEHV